MKSPFVGSDEQLPRNWLIANVVQPTATAENQRRFTSFRHCLDQATHVFQPDTTGRNALQLLAPKSPADDQAKAAIGEETLRPLAAALHQFAPEKLQDFLNCWPDNIELPVEALADLARRGQLSGAAQIRCLKRRGPELSRLAAQLCKVDELRAANGVEENEFWASAFRCPESSDHDGGDIARLRATAELMALTRRSQAESGSRPAQQPSSLAGHQLFNRHGPNNLVQAMRYLSRFAHTQHAWLRPGTLWWARRLLDCTPLRRDAPMAQWMNRVETPELTPLLHRLCDKRPFPRVKPSAAPAFVFAVIDDPPPADVLWLNQLLHSLQDIYPGRHLLPFSDMLRLGHELLALQSCRDLTALQPEIVSLCLEAMLPPTRLRSQSIATRATWILEVVSANAPTRELRTLHKKLVHWQRSLRPRMFGEASISASG